MEERIVEGERGRKDGLRMKKVVVMVVESDEYWWFMDEREGC
jgi:hypothetical protein